MPTYARSAARSSTTVRPQPDPAIADHRASFAAAMTEATFCRNCPHPDSYSFLDLCPEEVASLRAARRPGAAK